MSGRTLAYGAASADDSQGDFGLELPHAIDNVSQSITVQLTVAGGQTCDRF